MKSKFNVTLSACLAFLVIGSGCSSSSPTTDTETPDTENPPATGDPDGDNPTEQLPQDQPTTANFLIPNVEAGSDADRLFKGINRQVAFTLLDLNARLSQGLPLSAQENDCMGTYDPAFGEQLLSINCAQPLATGNVVIRVTQASYHNTSACHADISNGVTDNCILQSARLSIPTVFETPALPEGSPAGTPNLPQPVVGMEIYYAIGGTNLRIENAVPALTGVFLCDMNLETNGTSTTTPQSCASTIAQTADRLDALIPE